MNRWLFLSCAMLLVPLLVSVICATDGDADESRALAHVKKLGGSVGVDENNPDQVAQVDFRNNKQITDGDLAPLRFLTRLQKLELGKTKVTDKGLRYVGDLTGLRTLDLGGTQVTDQGLKNLERLVHLQSLDLSETHISDSGLEQLKKFTELQSLDLSNTDITDKGAESLKELKKLRVLDLSSYKITDKGLEQLRDLGDLRLLHLTGSRITDDGLKKLEAFPNLDNLSLDFTRVSDKGLIFLNRLTKLRKLDLSGTQVTDAGINDLQKALPNVKVTCLRPPQSAAPASLERADDKAPPAWKEFASKEGRFKVLMPRLPEEEKHDVDTDFGKGVLVAYSARSQGAWYVLGYCDFREIEKQPVEKVLDSCRDLTLQRTGGKLISDKKIKLGDYAGREFQTEAEGNDVHRTRVYLVGQRMFTLSVSGKKEVVTSKAPESFFDSFKLTK